MVGYPSFVGRTVGHALQNVPWTEVEGYDSNAPPYNLRKLSADDIMYAGNAYWIKVSDNAVWDITNYYWD